MRLTTKDRVRDATSGIRLVVERRPALMLVWIVFISRTKAPSRSHSQGRPTALRRSASGVSLRDRSCGFCSRFRWERRWPDERTCPYGWPTGRLAQSTSTFAKTCHASRLFAIRLSQRYQRSP